MHYSPFARLLALLLALLCLSAPCACAAASSDNPTAGIGDTGAPVLRIQVRLSQLGYMTTDPTGEYDLATFEAVKAFQSAYGLVVTGEVDRQLSDILFSDSAKKYEIHVTYILNTNTKKFHYPDCDSVDKIAPKNYEEFTGSREDAIALGFVPCKKCNP